MSKWIISKWKPTGAYTIMDAVDRNTYSSQKRAECVLKRNGWDYEYVVRSV